LALGQFSTLIMLLKAALKDTLGSQRHINVKTMALQIQQHSNTSSHLTF